MKNTIQLDGLGDRAGAIARAADLLKAGEVVAFPTETVYGLGANAFDPDAVAKIFAAKGRPSDNPLIVHLADVHDLSSVASAWPIAVETLGTHFWPGPLTLVLPRHPSIPSVVSGGLDTVAVRIPAHPIARGLIRAAGVPLVAPSANRSGLPSPTMAQHVWDDLNGRIAGILDGGPCEIGIESTVLDLTGDRPRILRPGQVTAEQISVVLDQKVEIAAHLIDGEAVLSPGLKYKHYAPQAAVHLFDSEADAIAFLARREKPFLLATQCPPSFPIEAWRPLETTTLYASLREADQIGCQAIAILVDEQVKSQNGLYDRIKRAST